MGKELQDKIALVGYLMQKKRKKEIKESDREFDPTNGQGRILVALEEYNGASLRDLAFALDLAPSSMSEMLGKLEKKGYITREVDKNDKRAQVIMLTDKGKSAVQVKPVGECDLFSCFDETEKETFGNYLDKLIEVLGIKLDYDDEKIARKLKKVVGNSFDKFVEFIKTEV
ncbi:MAG: MarR family transcriptional regulator [Firmicutes bacterium]|nr:MarR family transcriptional regulator [Bacillota bacterium]